MGVVKEANLTQAAPRRISSGPIGPGAMPTGKPATAAVVQQDDTHAVIEVTCSCGRKIQLQCDYAQPET